MKMSRFVTTLTFGGVVIATTAGCSPASDSAPDDVIVYDAAYLSYDSMEALVRDAELIVEGTVVSSEVREIALKSESDSSDPETNPTLGATTKPVEMPPLIYTVATIKVERVIQGDADVGSLVEVKQLGGTLGNKTAVQRGAAELAKGNTYAVYLGSGDYGPSSLLNQEQSAYIEVASGEFASVVPGNAVASEVAAKLSSDH